MHARKAWLDGLSPKENRDVPPLDYELVYRVKQEQPRPDILLNGGIETLEEAEAHLAHVDGVMLGRAAYHNPAMLAEVDARFFGGAPGRPGRGGGSAIAIMSNASWREGARLHSLTKPMLGLFNGGRPGARPFRRHLSENAARARCRDRSSARRRWNK